MTQISVVKCCEVLLVKGVVRFCMVKLCEVQLKVMRGVVRSSVVLQGIVRCYNVLS